MSQQIIRRRRSRRPRTWQVKVGVSCWRDER